jgi:hypothetical protein
VQEAAPAAKAAFDVLRGHAYNPFSTEGAASNIFDIVEHPSEIHGQKFLYVSPNSLGYVAFDLGKGSALLGLNNSDGLGALILGYATPAFGVALDYSIGKLWTTSEEGQIDESMRTTSPGDNIGLHFSLPSGIYARLGWRTYAESYAREASGGGNSYEESLDYSTLSARAGMLGNAGSLSYNFYADVMRTGGSANVDGDKAVEEDTHSEITLGFNIGYAALQTQTARLIVGSNNSVGLELYDKVDKILESGSIIRVQIQPNILGEVILAKSCLAFIGARQSIDLTAGEMESLRDKDNSRLEIRQEPTSTFFAGMRYQNEIFALEAMVSSNPFAAFGGNNILGQLGGFIYF